MIVILTPLTYLLPGSVLVKAEIWDVLEAFTPVSTFVLVTNPVIPAGQVVNGSWDHN